MHSQSQAGNLTSTPYSRRESVLIRCVTLVPQYDVLFPISWKEMLMESNDQNKVEIEAKEVKQEEATEQRAIKIRLKTGILAGRVIAVHL